MEECARSTPMWRTQKARSKGQTKYALAKDVESEFKEEESAYMCKEPSLV